LADVMKGLLVWIQQNQLLFHVLWLSYLVLMWLVVTKVMTEVSGWSRLMVEFPDRPEEPPLLQLRWQSGTLGKFGKVGIWNIFTLTHRGLVMRNILTLSVCHSGLRVGIMRLFGLFCRDFFVPWNAISITRKEALFGQTATLEFGKPSIGYLTIAADTADQLARAVTTRWPEVGLFPKES
jgi:hypothetical protein